MFQLLAPLAISGLAKLFGGASKSQSDSKLAQSRNQLDWEKLKLAAPGMQAKTSLAAALAKNYQPQTVQWNGPGSGLRGEMPKYSGGTAGSMASASQDPMLQAMLSNAVAGRAPAQYSAMENPKSSIWDKLLGGGAFGLSALSTLLKSRSGGGGGDYSEYTDN